MNSFTRKISGLLIAGMLLAPMSALADSGSFVDIPADFEFLNAIDYLKTSGTVQGYPDQTFRPEKGVSRAEFLKMILLSSGMKAPATLESIDFPDVSSEDWFYEFVQKGKTLKLVKGYEDGSFKPDQGVTRAEGLKMIMQAYLGQDNVQLTDKNFPSDVKESDWYAPFVQLGRSKWIMTDYDDGLFRPNQPLTRAVAAEILFRSHEVFTKKLDHFDVTTEWKNFESNLGSFSLMMPRNWTIIPEVTRTIFWKMDPTSVEQDYAFLTPLSAKLIVRHPAKVSAGSSAEYFDSVRKFSVSVFGQSEVQFSELKADNPTLDVKVPNKGVENWYVYLAGNQSLVLYSETGHSSLAQKLSDTITAMVTTLKYRPDLVSTEQQKEIQNALSQINSNILVEGQGKEMIKLLPDGIIIETDEIGVGTGPVDYYYSEKMNITLKLERTSDTILAVRAGKTTRF